MEILIDKKMLLDGLDKIGKLLPSKPSIASLGGIYLEGKKDGISLTATDLQITLKVFLEAQVKEKEEILFPGKKFISLVKEIPDKTVQLRTKENTLFLSSKNFHYKFLLMNVDEYPKLPSEQELFAKSDKTTVPSSLLLEMIAKTKYCVNINEPRIYFRGVLMEGRGNTLTMVGTDTRRLSLIKKTLDSEISMKMILPLRFLEILPAVIPEESVAIAFTKNQIGVQSERMLFISQLLEGEFPEYEKVIPSGETLLCATINRAAFLESLSRISLLVSEKSNAMKFQFRKDLLVLSFESPDIGSGEEKLHMTYSGPDTDIVFNPEYVIDFLRTTEKESLSFFFLDKDKPALLQEEEEKGYQYVVMPIKA
jgi:DNA polymerase-3 subunit beta